MRQFNSLILCMLLLLSNWSNPSFANCPDPYATLDTRSFGQLNAIFNCRVFEAESFTARRPDNHDRNYGRTSAFWAQEMVGGDLALEYMQRIGEPDLTTNVGIVDSGFALTHLPPDRFRDTALACRRAVRRCNPDTTDMIFSGMTRDEIEAVGMPKYQVCPQMRSNCPEFVSDAPSHGTSVSQLIAGQPPMSISERSRISWLGTFDENPRQMADNLIAQNPRPAIVNASMQCPEAALHLCQDWTEHYARIADHSILVKSAGNHFPENLDPISSTVNSIVVGSVAPNGLMSVYSQEGPQVTISAPSDYSIRSRSLGDGDDERTTSRNEQFSGTSGAAPLVTSALSNVVALLPGITTDELKTLLQQTAIQTAGFIPNKGQNGAGSLNALKLTQVAHRLRQRGWPEARSQLNSPELYNFSDQVARLVERVSTLMQELPYNQDICNRHKRALKMLRQAHFLDPSNPTLQRQLGNIYRANGLEAQGDFVDPNFRSKRDIALSINPARSRLLSIIRSGQFHPTRDFALLSDIVRNSDPWPDLIGSLGTLIPQHLNIIKQSLQGADDEQAGKLLDEVALLSHHSPEKAQHFYQTFYRANLPAKNGKMVYYFAKELRPEFSTAVFHQALSGNNHNMKLGALTFLPTNLEPVETRRLLLSIATTSSDLELVQRANKALENYPEISH